MKGLVKRIFTPLILSATLLTSTPALAQEKEKKDFNPVVFASGGIGFFRGNDKKIRNIYGIDTFPNYSNMPKLNGSIGYFFSKHLRLKGDFSFVANSGEPNNLPVNNETRLEGVLSYLEEPYIFENIQIINKNSQISFGQFTGIIEYSIPIPFKNFTPTLYIGAGPSVIYYNEKISMKFIANNNPESKMVSKKVKGSTIGLTGMLGIEFLSKKKDDFEDFLYPYIQLSGTSAIIKEDLGKVNIGGLSIESGFRFKFVEFKKNK